MMEDLDPVDDRGSGPPREGGVTVRIVSRRVRVVERTILPEGVRDVSN